MTDPATIKKIARMALVCVNAHDRCEGSHPCPYCEPAMPLRDTNTGQFLAMSTVIKEVMKDE